MEGVLICGVGAGHRRGEGDDRRRARPARRRRARSSRRSRPRAINVDMIVQNVVARGTTDMSFTAPRADLPRLEGVLDALAREIGADGFTRG